MISAAIRLDPNELGGLLWRMPKARPLFFFCSRGYLADQAAREARDAGFSHAFSLGGIYDIVEDQTEE